MFDNLMKEVEVINQAWGWVGALDAIRFMQEHRADYQGTVVGRELAGFMRLGRDMMAEVDQDPS